MARAAQAFTELGDHEVAAQCLRTARRLVSASNDSHGHDLVNALAERLSGRVAGVDPAQAF